MSPLDKIKTWFIGLTAEFQIDIAALAGYFHLDKRISNEIGSETKLQLFIEFLDSNGLEAKEIVKRTLYISKLIDFTFNGRDTEDGWRETLDRLLALRAKAAESTMDLEFIDSQLNQLPERKETWLAICASWNQLKNNFITDKKIIDWYWSETLKNKT